MRLNKWDEFKASLSEVKCMHLVFDIILESVSDFTAKQIVKPAGPSVECHINITNVKGACFSGYMGFPLVCCTFNNM